ncbi:MAG: hypothetical protein HYU39_04060 [Thaumarchaeota archaeon]|nr:hypothetical protein [Nitrososphaerota archaeon]
MSVLGLSIFNRARYNHVPVMVRRRVRGFLDLSVEERSLVADALAIVKLHLKRNFTLSQLGFLSTWDNVDTTTLLQKDPTHYMRLVEGSEMSPKDKGVTLYALNTIFSFLTLDGATSNLRKGLDRWLG